LPHAYWKILEPIQESLNEPSPSGVVKNILDRFFAEKTYLQEYVGLEKVAIARKMLK